eukprot:TRINITY_DN5294_c0_g1_i1.p1 TRINITY_DN5294_c0_g1~~TRINITY_DN5294_c0_g1_i1.p1  ORF type:complete len:382 (-),score=91.35 TRINITY_DN5294_c0_g1_i1:592-1737(-)
MTESPTNFFQSQKMYDDEEDDDLVEMLSQMAISEQQKHRNANGTPNEQQEQEQQQSPSTKFSKTKRTQKNFVRRQLDTNDDANDEIDEIEMDSASSSSSSSATPNSKPRFRSARTNKHRLSDIDIESIHDDTGIFGDLLPPEILCHIFHFLDWRDWLRCRRVCQTWHDAVEMLDDWNSLDFSISGSITPIAALGLVSRFAIPDTGRELHTLSLARKDLSMTKLRKFVPHMPYVQHLDLGYCRGVENDDLAMLLTYCVNIRELKLHWNASIWYRAFTVIQFSKLKKLETLVLRNCTHFWDYGAHEDSTEREEAKRNEKEFVRALVNLGSCSTLQHLDMSMMALRTNDLDILTQSVRNSKGMGCRISDMCTGSHLCLFPSSIW